jgi:Carbohydrate-binding module 48 (Isoamylase N-terminal domain)
VDYRLAVRHGERVDIIDDPYRWRPTLGEIDLHLIGEGRHERLWQVLGAHVRSYDTTAGAVTGTSFAVWAPGARGVRVTGDFDDWSGRAHPMRMLGSAGCESCSCRAPRRVPATNSASWAPTDAGATRPTRWPSAPRSRPARPRSSTPPPTSGPTPTG